MVHWLKHLTFAGTFAVSLGAASAQEQIFRSVNVAEGARVRLGIHGDVSKECTSKPAPDIKVATSPKNGTLSISTGTMKAGAMPRCPQLAIPARAVFYQANGRYRGPDEVVYSFQRSDGNTASVTIKISVGGTVRPGTKPNEAGVSL